MSAPLRKTQTGPDENLAALQALIHELGHYLPSQPPLHAFVHHNTLHHFEHLRFEDAVVEAGKVFDAEPFLKESDYHQHIAKKRITEHDLQAAVNEYLDEFSSEKKSVLNLASHDFYTQRISKFIAVPEAATIRYLMDEQGLLETFSSLVSSERTTELTQFALAQTGQASHELSTKLLLTQLWHKFTQCDLSFISTSDAPKRLRDYLCAITDTDLDELINPIMIRLSAAFLDQGIAHWSMPDREQGLWNCFKSLYNLPFCGPNYLLRELKPLINSAELKDASSLEAIAWALKKLKIEPTERADFLLHTLLALRGWAGMIQHFEQRPDRAPVQALESRLNDFLAIRLLLEIVMGNQVMQEHFKVGLDINELKIRYSYQNKNRDTQASQKIQLVYEA